MILFCIGANHKSASIDVRESLFVPENGLTEFLPTIKSKFSLNELVGISTCNRLEIYGVSAQGNLANNQLIEIYENVCSRAAQYTQATFDQLTNITYSHLGSDAIHHIFSVASSLDSMVIGETQIVGQFKEAFALAQKLQLTGPVLTRLCQDALSVSKKIRTNTGIGKKVVSIGHTAVHLAEKVVGPLADKSVLLVGAGEMAQTTAKYLARKNPKKIFVCNRNVVRAEDLVKELNAGHAHALNDLPQILEIADVIICATGSQEYVITKEMVDRSAKSRRGNTQIIVDISLPRNVDPLCAKRSDLYLFDIDDLQQVVDQNIEERLAAAEQAEKIVIESTREFNSWLASQNLSPVLKKVRTHIQDLVQREMTKTYSKDPFKSLDTKAKESLDQMIESVVQKLMGDVSSNARRIQESNPEVEIARILQELFSREES